MDLRATASYFAGNPISGGFRTDLSGELCFRSDRVKVWAFGPTHYNCDFTIGEDGADPLRLVTNQRGYPNKPKATRFNARKTIEA